jgi:hypothetical protein
VLPNAGKLSKKKTDVLAQSEYEKFILGRRAALEAEGAAGNMDALLEASKMLPKLRGKKT